jgi:hypothetical protein
MDNNGHLNDELHVPQPENNDGNGIVNNGHIGHNEEDEPENNGEPHDAPEAENNGEPHPPQPENNGMVNNGHIGHNEEDELADQFNDELEYWLNHIDDDDNQEMQENIEEPIDDWTDEEKE